MPPDQQDAWETETLTPVNDAEVTIVDAYFEEGKFGTQLVWVMRVDVPHDPINIPFETFKGWFSCGKDWVIQDAGASITKPTSDPSKPAKIHASSNYGKIMDRVLKIGVDMRGRGLPTEARVWKDLRFHMQREVVKYTDLPTAEGGTMDREASILLPVTHLPALGGAVPVPIVAPVEAAAPASAPTAPVSTPLPVDGSIESHLISVILGKSSVIEGKQAAMRDPRIAADDAISSRILENQLIESYFEGDSPVLVIADGKIAKASG